MTFPAAVPEIPSADVGKSAAYYVNTLGLTLDWGDDQGGIAGIQRGIAGCFSLIAPSESPTATQALSFSGSISIARPRWTRTLCAVEDRASEDPADLDGNLIRVFYDFRGDV
jgi:hypothetical protein